MTIQPIQSTFPTTPFTATGRGAAARSASPTSASSAASPTASAVSVDSIPASPPAEVLAEMASAAQTADRLAASGKALHFSLDATSGRVSVEVHDLAGNTLGTLSPSAALSVATGASLT